jgi:hypothetical protein
MAHTRAWTEVTPADGDLIRNGARDIRRRMVDIRERLEYEHIWNDDQTNDGMHAFKTATKTDTNYTVTWVDTFVLVSTGNSDRTITLPAVSATYAGKIFWFKKIDSGTGDVIIDGDGAETIDGATTYTMTAENEWCGIILNDAGTAWELVSRGSAIKIGTQTAAQVNAHDHDTTNGDAALGAGVVDTTQLATDAVETAKIADSNVTTAKIADDAVTAAKMGFPLPFSILFPEASTTSTSYVAGETFHIYIPSGFTSLTVKYEGKMTGGGNGGTYLKCDTTGSSSSTESISAGGFTLTSELTVTVQAGWNQMTVYHKRNSGTSVHTRCVYASTGYLA